MKPEILARLSHLENEESVKIVYACESGSRAWGFPSADSDYDVRFLYLRPQAWYLSIDLEKKRDVIERPIDDQIDLNGWDLRKALWLYRKSNPPLLEWLGDFIDREMARLEDKQFTDSTEKGSFEELNRLFRSLWVRCGLKALTRGVETPR